MFYPRENISFIATRWTVAGGLFFRIIHSFCIHIDLIVARALKKAANWPTVKDTWFCGQGST
jgi:hypothetical protein